MMLREIMNFLKITDSLSSLPNENEQGKRKK